MEVKHLIELLSELTPGTRCKYVRGDDVCTFVKIDPQEQRLYTKTPLNEEFTFAQSFIIALANEIEENVPFNTSQLLNNKGSNRAVIDSIIAHTSEFYWLQKDRSKFTVWVPSAPHNAGELVEWKDIKALAHNRRTKNIDSSEPLQQIFYGAPGTGKSHRVNEVTEAQPEENVFRTTFHPDSDYSTFVGCYKPTRVKSERLQRMNLSLEDLAKELGSYYSNSELGKIGGIQKFCFEYYPYIDGEYMSVNVTKLLELAGVPKDYNVEINKYIKFCHLLPKQDPNEITYTFVPQAFTKAYLRAWQTEDPVYLVIEEINRGNCAQIFGDLFQLLDRKEGKSEYPIKPDTDLGNFIAENLTSPVEGAPEKVVKGELMILPKNLYIWATMNTSDQSLFPIDSAFKRRWDWKYIPINEHEEESYKINIGDAKYDWWGFLEKINKVIGQVTSSEDKKLGYFFVKAIDKVVDANKFVGKVLFYLWNDVFKNYGFENAIFSRGENTIFNFSDFFDKNGDPDTSVVNEFLKKLDETIDKEHSFVSIDNEGSPSSLIINYNGEKIEGNSAVSKYIEFINRVISEKDVDEVANCLGGDMTKTPPEGTTRKFRQVGDSEWYLATNIGIDDMKDNINKIKKLGVDVVLE